MNVGIAPEMLLKPQDKPGVYACLKAFGESNSEWVAPLDKPTPSKGV